MYCALNTLVSKISRAVAGSVDSGKSTLVAILTHGAGGAPLLDNGRGSARMAVFRHKHEIESGRTSSISEQILGYDAAGAEQVLLCPGTRPQTPDGFWQWPGLQLGQHVWANRLAGTQ